MGGLIFLNPQLLTKIENLKAGIYALLLSLQFQFVCHLMELSSLEKLRLFRAGDD